MMGVGYQNSDYKNKGKEGAHAITYRTTGETTTDLVTLQHWCGARCFLLFCTPSVRGCNINYSPCSFITLAKRACHDDMMTGMESYDFSDGQSQCIAQASV